MWELNREEDWAPKNWCLQIAKKTLESPLDWKEIKPVNPRGNELWIFIGRSELKMKLQYFGHPMRRAISLERTLCWEGLRAGGEGGHRGWDGWMASLTWWTWVLANSRRQARTGRPGVPHSTELQGGRQDLVTEQQQQSPEVPDLANKKYCQWCTGHILKTYLIFVWK